MATKRVIYHNCFGTTGKGIVEFATDADGMTSAFCRQCGVKLRIERIFLEDEKWKKKNGGGNDDNKEGD